MIAEHVFPFLRTLGGDESTYAHHMKDARFTIPTPALLARFRDRCDAQRNSPDSGKGVRNVTGSVEQAR
jgi:type I restriction enzyme M protein